MQLAVQNEVWVRRNGKFGEQSIHYLKSPTVELSWHVEQEGSQG